MSEVAVFLGKHDRSQNDIWDALWGEVDSWQGLTIRKLTLSSKSGDRALVIRIDQGRKFIWIEENRDEDPTLNKRYLVQIVSQYCFEDDQINIALHKGRLVEGELRRGLPPGMSEKISLAEFLHAPGEDRIYDALRRFKEKRAGDNSFEQLCQAIKKKPPISDLSQLKHRIAHLFLPIDFDLQGIEELYRYQSEHVRVKYPNEHASRKAAVKYLKEALERKPQGYYRRKLADLWFLVTKRRDLGVKPSLSVNSLADGKAVHDVFLDEKGNSGQSEWQEFLTLCGLCVTPAGRGIGSVRRAIPEAPIEAFMVLMDQKILGRNNLTEKEVEQIVNFPVLSKPGSSPSSMNFNSWFCELDRCLDNLRNAL